MMKVIYDFEREKYLQYQRGIDPLIDLYQDYQKGAIIPTHNRVTDKEFLTLPKLFVYANHVDVVSGNQLRGGCHYVKHCRSFKYSIDRKNGVVLLKGKEDSHAKN